MRSRLEGDYERLQALFSLKQGMERDLIKSIGGLEVRPDHDLGGLPALPLQMLRL